MRHSFISRVLPSESNHTGGSKIISESQLKESQISIGGDQGEDATESGDLHPTETNSHLPHHHTRFPHWKLLPKEDEEKEMVIEPERSYRLGRHVNEHLDELSGRDFIQELSHRSVHRSPVYEAVRAMTSSRRYLPPPPSDLANADCIVQEL
jgi:hypothetical protein